MRQLATIHIASVCLCVCHSPKIHSSPLFLDRWKTGLQTTAALLLPHTYKGSVRRLHTHPNHPSLLSTSLLPPPHPLIPGPSTYVQSIRRAVMLPCTVTNRVSMKHAVHWQTHSHRTQTVYRACLEAPHTGLPPPKVHCAGTKQQLVSGKWCPAIWPGIVDYCQRQHLELCLAWNVQSNSH